MGEISRKNIAVIVSGIDEEYQNFIICGIRDYALKNNINICCFTSFGGIIANKRHDIGEYNIFSLINYKKFDGVILLTNTIASPAVVNTIITNVKKAGIPVVNIDADTEGMYYIGIDNASAMTKMVRHFVDKHHVRRINFVTGPLNNIDSIQRFNAYKAVLKECGIPFEEERIYHGLFRKQDGMSAIEEFVKSPLPFPEAIICANDTMALGAVMTLKKYKYNVPDDVLISGFDNIYAARNFYPEISSVKRPLYQSGYMACEKIHKDINKIPQAKKEILETEPVFSQSCGCANHTNDDMAEFKKLNYEIIDKCDNDIRMISRMLDSFTECETLDDTFEYLKNYISEINCEEFYLCMCNDWHSAGYVVKSKMTKGYTSKVSVPISYYKGKFRSYNSFETELMLPELFKEEDDSKIYYFAPIHFQDICLGYCVICNSEFPLNSKLYHTWLMNISNAFENIRKILSLETAVAKLEELYVLDPLTQIYNRNGFNKFTSNTYNNCIANKRNVMIGFIDMDGLKFTNDHYGHKEGDNAIMQIANVLKEICVSGEIFARFGGDEFIIFGADYTNEKAEMLCINFQDAIRQYNSISGKPYKVDASIGYYIEVPECSKSIYNMISYADKRMYEMKQKKTHSKYIRAIPDEND